MFDGWAIESSINNNTALSDILLSNIKRNHKLGFVCVSESSDNISIISDSHNQRLVFSISVFKKRPSFLVDKPTEELHGHRTFIYCLPTGNFKGQTMALIRDFVAASIICFSIAASVFTVARVGFLVRV